LSLLGIQFQQPKQLATSLPEDSEWAALAAKNSVAVVVVVDH
jgi:hypothetical protein